MNKLLQWIIPLVLVTASVSAQAHKRWMLPSDFSLSEAETVSVDFTASNNIFYVDAPMPLAGVSIVAPDGKVGQAQNPMEGSRRSSFDIAVEEEGTYRIYDRGRPMYFVQYILPGGKEPVRDRGSLQGLKASLPAGASEVQYARSTALIETWVTLGTSSSPAPLVGYEGLVMEPISHPNALYSDEPAQFRFTQGGAPVAGLLVMLVAEGTRYRDSQA